MLKILFEISEEAEYNKILVKLFQTPTEVIEVLKVLFFWKDVPKTPIYDGATKTLVSDISYLAYNAMTVIG